MSAPSTSATPHAERTPAGPVDATPQASGISPGGGPPYLPANATREQFHAAEILRAARRVRFLDDAERVAREELDELASRESLPPALRRRLEGLDDRIREIQLERTTFLDRILALASNVPDRVL